MTDDLAALISAARAARREVAECERYARTDDHDLWEGARRKWHDAQAAALRRCREEMEK